MPEKTQVLSANQTITFDVSRRCDESIRIARGQEPNQYAVWYPEGVESRPIVLLTGGTFTEIDSGTETSTRFSLFEDEEELPEGTLLSFEFGAPPNVRYWGVKSEEVTEQYILYDYKNPAALAGRSMRALRCPDDEEDRWLERALAAMLIPQESGIPCIAATQAEVEYVDEFLFQCDETVSISISAGGDSARNTFFVDYTSGFGNPLIYVPQGDVTFQHLEDNDEEYTVTNIVSFSEECELPERVLNHVEYQGLFYGFKEEDVGYIRRQYRLIRTGSAVDDSREVMVFAYLLDGACFASSNALIPFVPRLPAIRRSDCWVELEAQDSSFVTMAYGSANPSFRNVVPTIRAINGDLDFVGIDQEEAEKVVEFEGLERPPSDALFSFRHRGLYYGFRPERTSHIRRMYKLTPHAPNGQEAIFVYAYNSFLSCHAYDQIMVTPPYTEEQHEEHEVYRVASRIIMTEEGVYACPAPLEAFADLPSMDEQIREAFAVQEGEADPYLIAEIVWEQGYIDQFHYRPWARIETHNHPRRPLHPFLATLAGGKNPDYYLRWLPPNKIESSHSEVAPGGRNLWQVYCSIEKDMFGMPRGVFRKFGQLHVIGDVPSC